MRRSLTSGVRALPLAVALAACTQSMPDFTQFKPFPSTKTFLPQNMDTYVPPATASRRGPVGPEGLVDGQGFCAALAPPPAVAQGSETEVATQAPPPPPAATLGPVGLDMTECAVVRAIGVPQSVNIGANERGERRVTMVYIGNERAGTYEFIGGRLSALERGPEPPPPPKQEKKPPKKKRPATVKQQAEKQPST